MLAFVILLDSLESYHKMDPTLTKCHISETTTNY